jgi:adenylylsulfate kinase
MKILIMGLSGAGKTTLAEKLVTKLKSEYSVLWLNADKIRKQYDDWDFTINGRLRQSHRINKLANESTCDHTISDFIAPTPNIRKIFSADYTIWVDTINYCDYHNTNILFQPPKKYNYRIENYNNHNKHVDCIFNDLINV